MPNRAASPLFSSSVGKSMPLVTLFLLLSGCGEQDTSATVQTLQTPPAQNVELRPWQPAKLRSVEILQKLPVGTETAFLLMDAETGQSLESLNPEMALVPASTMKIISSAALWWQSGEKDGWWSSELLIPGADWEKKDISRLTLSGNANPTLRLRVGDNSVRALAEQAKAHGIETVEVVTLAPERVNSESWEKAYINTPISWLMPQEWLNNRPRSAQDMRRRLHGALVYELELAGIEVKDHSFYEDQKPLESAKGVAVVHGNHEDLIGETLRPSDNLRAEVIMAAFAANSAKTGEVLGRAEAGEKMLEVLANHGISIQNANLDDGSGLSEHNRLSPRTLVETLNVIYAEGDPSNDAAKDSSVLRAGENFFAEALPKAGQGQSKYGVGGTLFSRMHGLDVWAKTGTLSGVSALAGYAITPNGRVLSFAVLMNGPSEASILQMRAVQDELLKDWVERHNR